MSFINRTALLLLCVAIVTSSHAQQCTVSTTGLSWSNYDQLEEQPNYSEGDITVNCDGITPYAIYMGKGQGSAASFAPRKMAGETESLDYFIFLDGAYSKVWGDGTEGSFVKNGLGSGVYPVYGVIPPRQAVPVGSYTDLISITILW